MKKTLLLIILSILNSAVIYAQSDQEKAQQLVKNYLNRKNLKVKNISFSSIQVLRSSFSNTKQYKNYQDKIDSLKLAGRRIDARIAKMKTTAELNQAKKDSNRLSHELVATSDELIDFMTAYKGNPVGWQIKANVSKRSRKTFYFNQELTQIDSVR